MPHLRNDYETNHPIHDMIFGHPDVIVDDTPPGAIPENVNMTNTAVQPDRFKPMRNVGDTDQSDWQPDGGPRR